MNFQKGAIKSASDESYKNLGLGWENYDTQLKLFLVGGWTNPFETY